MLYTIRNKNRAGQFHGYQQWHMLNTLAFRGNCYNGKYSVGYTEWHTGKVPKTIYFIQ